jgi:hypothetical protein
LEAFGLKKDRGSTDRVKRSSEAKGQERMSGFLWKVVMGPGRKTSGCIREEKHVEGVLNQ